MSPDFRQAARPAPCGDAPLASGVIVLTTLLAAVTLTLWVFLLRTLGLMA